MNKSFLSIFAIAFYFMAGAQKITPFYGPFPEPAPNKAMLFYLQRTMDRNTVIYELNYDADGQLNAKKPVKVYWIDFEESARISQLTFAQNKFAYGIESEVLDRSKAIYQIHLVSYKKIKILLKPSGKEDLHQAHTTIKGRPAVLTSIFVRITGGTYLKPVVDYLELVGVDPKTGQQIKEQIRPDTEN